MSWIGLAMVALACMHAVQAASPSCLSTYHSISIYWGANSGAIDRNCSLLYKKDGASTWLSGYDLVWDNRTNIKTAYP